MFDSFGNAFNRKTPQKGGPVFQEASGASPLQKTPGERKPVFSKIFRWCPPDGQTQNPTTVEVVGTFTHWQKVPLIHDGAVGAWHVLTGSVQTVTVGNPVPSAAQPLTLFLLLTPWAVSFYWTIRKVWFS